MGRWTGSPFRFVDGGCQASIVFVWPPCTTFMRPENMGLVLWGGGGGGGGGGQGLVTRVVPQLVVFMCGS